MAGEAEREEEWVRVWHLNREDCCGGAARAVQRVHRALLKEGVDSSIHVSRKRTDDPLVSVLGGRAAHSRSKYRTAIGSLPRGLLRTRNGVVHWAAFLPSGWPRLINDSEAEIVHLHWICGEMVSVKDIGQLKKPVVWTLHDMWPFCGAEHYAQDRRYRDGYTKTNRPSHESGFDLNRWTWCRKRRYWRRPMEIVTPSRWLASCAKESMLMKGWEVSVVPNALDTNVFRRMERSLCREALSLPKSAKIVLFGAADGVFDPRKGFDLLVKAMGKVKEYGFKNRLEFMVLGAPRKKAGAGVGSNVRWLGRVDNEEDLVLAYNAADLVVVPSRQDNLPQLATEAQACGIPVVAFDVGGLSDAVEHKESGYLARPFEVEDLAYGIEWVLQDEQRHDRLSAAARLRSLRLWSPREVAEKYKRIYEKSLGEG